MKLICKRTKRYYKLIYPAAILILFLNIVAIVYSANKTITVDIKSIVKPTRTTKPAGTPTPTIIVKPTNTVTPSAKNTIATTNNWIYSLEPGNQLDLPPGDLKWFFLNGQLHVVTIENGQLVIYIQDNNGNYSERERFGPEDTILTAFQLTDINEDKIPDIIAGTVDPGFICIYKYVDDKWILNNYERYVWSSITNITTGSFDAINKGLLVQNQEGFLFLLKINDSSLDLIWKSPTAWRPISSFTILDINQDLKDEIIVSYRTGGIGILVMDNNQIISVWENYVWGKILAVAKGDWDNDNQTEFIFSTSQKVLYILGYDKNKKGYLFESQLSQLNYAVEMLYFRNYYGVNQLFLTDTSGKLHLLEYNPVKKVWLENFFCATGRIMEIIVKSENDPFLLLGKNRKVSNLLAYPTKELKLQYLDQKYELIPAALFQKGQLYVSPAFFTALPDLGIKYTINNKKGVAEINAGETVIGLSKKDMTTFKVNNVNQENADRFLWVEDNIYLKTDSYYKLLNINLEFDLANKTVVLKVPVTENAENQPAVENTEVIPVMENADNVTVKKSTEDFPVNDNVDR